MIPIFVMFGGLALGAQEVEGLQVTTHERLETEAWWPTMSTSPLGAFAGSAACTQCHADEVAHGHETSMQRAGALGKDATFLRAKAPLTLSSPPYSYAVTASGAGLEYSVSDGHNRLAHMLDWVMGDGELGYTFLYQAEGRWYQSEATYYHNPAKLDLTTGLSEPGADLTSALGKVLSSSDARLCFGCHTVHATTAEGFNPQKAEAGLGCEACHGPGRAHVDQMTAAKLPGGSGQTQAALKSAIFNPAKLLPADANDFCGSCHRTFADVSFSTIPAQSNGVVRFQPYRLEESKCWRKGADARLTCVGCHDPHEPLKRDVLSYDRNCLQCHAKAVPGALAGGAKAAEHMGPVCPKADSQCVSCHMPKVTVASMHGEFTDHFIRVVQPGEGFLR